MKFILDPAPSRATVGAMVALLAAFFAGIRFADPAPWPLAIGLGLIAAGIAIRFVTNATLMKNEETTREGLYALCRHPMYIGTILIGAGIAVAFNHPVALAVFAAAVAISLYRIRKEEQFLLAARPDYAEYRKEVPAFPTPASVRGALASGRLRRPLSVRQCYLNGEILRLNLYLPLLLAAGFYLQLPAPLLAAGAAAALLVAAASMRFHPAEARRARADYFLPAALDAAVFAAVLLLEFGA